MTLKRKFGIKNNSPYSTAYVSLLFCLDTCSFRFKAIIR